MAATVDANVLVYASNEAEPVHEPARRLTERFATGRGIVYLFCEGFWGLYLATRSNVGRDIRNKSVTEP